MVNRGVSAWPAAIPSPVERGLPPVLEQAVRVNNAAASRAVRMRPVRRIVFWWASMAIASFTAQPTLAELAVLSVSAATCRPSNGPNATSSCSMFTHMLGSTASEAGRVLVKRNSREPVVENPVDLAVFIDARVLCGGVKHQRPQPLNRIDG